MGKRSLFVELPAGSTGNGIRLDRKGNLLIADYTGHNILKVDVFLKEVSVYAHSDSMNQPNDLAIRSSSGTLFASDPDWSASTGQLWRIDTTGEVVLLEKNMGTTNGIELSTDEKYLYVNESEQRKVWAYTIFLRNGDNQQQTPADRIPGPRDWTECGVMRKETFISHAMAKAP